MRDLNFNELGDLIISGGTIDTDVPNDANKAIANRLKVTILKTIPNFIDSLKSKFRGIRVIDSFKLEAELEDFLLLNITLPRSLISYLF